MAGTDFRFRKRAVRSLTPKIGVYILCDLDNTPIYVGQSVDGIRKRVGRHLTSARSDIIANRQLDVWEVAYVHTFPVRSRREIAPLESKLYHHYHRRSRLMNGTRPPKLSGGLRTLPKPEQIVQVMSDAEIRERRDYAQRLPRQAEHYAQIVSHFLTVKNSRQIAQAMDAHFQRLQTYHGRLLGLAADESEDSGE